MLARLSYALIGFVLGAMLGALLWWLYGTGFHPGITRPQVQSSPLAWIKYTGGICALLGFVFKDRVGDFVGSGVRTTLDFEVGRGSPSEWHASGWLVVLVIAAVAFAVWHFAS